MLWRKAAPVPSVISENMLRFPEAKERNPFTQSGHPHQKITGSESSICTHAESDGASG